MNILLQSSGDSSGGAGALDASVYALVALAALLVSIVSAVVAVLALRIQRRHNVLSVRPLPEVTVADYENSLRVKVRNNGSGPMIIAAMSISDGVVSRPALVDWMPALPGGRPWTHFSHRLENRSLLAGGEIVLLELTEYEKEQDYFRCRDAVREALSPLTVLLQYTDVYGTVFPRYSKDLEWFGRHENARRS